MTTPQHLRPHLVVLPLGGPWCTYNFGERIPEGVRDSAVILYARHGQQRIGYEGQPERATLSSEQADGLVAMVNETVSGLLGSNPALLAALRPLLEDGSLKWVTSFHDLPLSELAPLWSEMGAVVTMVDEIDLPAVPPTFATRPPLPPGRWPRMVPGTPEETDEDRPLASAARGTAHDWHRAVVQQLKLDEHDVGIEDAQVAGLLTRAGGLTPFVVEGAAPVEADTDLGEWLDARWADLAPVAPNFVRAMRQRCLAVAQVRGVRAGEPVQALAYAFAVPEEAPQRTVPDLEALERFTDRCRLQLVVLEGAGAKASQEVPRGLADLWRVHGHGGSPSLRIRSPEACETLADVFVERDQWERENGMAAASCRVFADPSYGATWVLTSADRDSRGEPMVAHSETVQLGERRPFWAWVDEELTGQWIYGDVGTNRSLCSAKASEPAPGLDRVSVSWTEPSQAFDSARVRFEISEATAMVPGEPRTTERVDRDAVLLACDDEGWIVYATLHGSAVAGVWVATVSADHALTGLLRVADEGKRRVDADDAQRDPRLEHARWLAVGYWAYLRRRYAVVKPGRAPREPAEAITALKAAAEALPDVPWIQLQHGRSLSRAGHPREAMVAWEKVGAEATVDRARAHLALGDPEEALRLADEALVYADDRRARYVRGMALDALGKGREAADELMAASRVPTIPTTFDEASIERMAVRGEYLAAGTATILQELGDHEAVLAHLDATKSNDALACMLRATSLRALGRKEEALVQLERARDKGHDGARQEILELQTSALKVTPPSRGLTDTSDEVDIGDRVIHKKYGPGEVVDVEDGAQTKVAVEFDSGVSRTLLLRFVEVQR